MLAKKDSPTERAKNLQKAGKTMKEIIDNIKQAEAEAERIISDARAQASKISNEAEAEVLRLDASVQEELKDAKKQVSVALAKEAQELYDKRIAQAKEEGQRLKESVGKNLEETANFVVERVLG